MGYKNSEDRRAAWERWFASLTPEKKQAYRKAEQTRQKAAWLARKAKPAFAAQRKAYNRLIGRFKKFGLSHEDFGYMMERCGGECPGCRREMKVYGKGDPAVAQIDHNHTTSEIRGLLCGGCNMILGYARDNAQVLRNLVAYLPQVP